MHRSYAQLSQEQAAVESRPVVAYAALLLNRFNGDGQDTPAQLARVVPYTQLGRDEGLVNAQLQSDHVVGSKLGRRERSINHHGSGGVEGQVLQHLLARASGRTCTLA